MKSMMFKVLFATTLAISIASGANASGDKVGGGGEIVTDPSGVAHLRDVIDEGTCVFVSGPEFMSRLPGFSDAMRSLPVRKPGLKYQILHVVSELNICLTRGKLRSFVPHPEEELTVYEKSSQQVAVRYERDVYIDMNLFEKLNADEQGLALVHESLHSFYPRGVDGRMMKLRTMVAAIARSMNDSPIRPSALANLIRQTGMVFPYVDFAEQWMEDDLKTLADNGASLDIIEAYLRSGYDPDILLSQGVRLGNQDYIDLALRYGASASKAELMWRLFYRENQLHKTVAEGSYGLALRLYREENKPVSQPEFQKILNSAYASSDQNELVARPIPALSFLFQLPEFNPNSTVLFDEKDEPGNPGKKGEIPVYALAFMNRQADTLKVLNQRQDLDFTNPAIKKWTLLRFDIGVDPWWRASYKYKDYDGLAATQVFDVAFNQSPMRLNPTEQKMALAYLTYSNLHALYYRNMIEAAESDYFKEKNRQERQQAKLKIGTATASALESFFARYPKSAKDVHVMMAPKLLDDSGDLMVRIIELMLANDYNPWTNAAYEGKPQYPPGAGYTGGLTELPPESSLFDRSGFHLAAAGYDKTKYSKYPFFSSDAPVAMLWYLLFNENVRDSDKVLPENVTEAGDDLARILTVLGQAKDADPNITVVHDETNFNFGNLLSVAVMTRNPEMFEKLAATGRFPLSSVSYYRSHPNVSGPVIFQALATNDLKMIGLVANASSATDLSAKDSEGKTPLQIAACSVSGAKEILKKAGAKGSGPIFGGGCEPLTSRPFDEP